MSIPGLGFTARIVEKFITTKMSPIFIMACVLAGAVALTMTPREEDPQIVVPLADVFVTFPGAGAEEVEKLVSTPLERRLKEIEGVEYVYSLSRSGQAMITVRYYVGEDKEKSLVKLYDKLMSSQDLIPPGVTGWLVKPVAIDDVPILTLTLWGEGKDDFELRRVADEVLDKLQSVKNTAVAYAVGGRKRQVRVILDPNRLWAHQTSALEVAGALAGANANLSAGSLKSANREYLVDVGPFLRSAQEVREIVVGAANGRPVYLQDVAQVMDGPEEAQDYTRMGFGPAWLRSEPPIKPAAEELPAVTIAVAKRKGTNAVKVAEAVLHKLEELKGTVIPSDIQVTVTRNYGESANEKVNELVKHLGIAIVTIVILLGLALGWREAAIVALAVPLTLAITLMGDLLLGYTINRVTLFALILSLGLLVDDPIVDVENIHRHYLLKQMPPLEATLVAVDEVRPPTILATFTVIMAIFPMYFVSGMMGPYMRPIPLNVSLAMLMSLLVAFTVTPWAAYHILKGEYGQHAEAYELKKSALYRHYRRWLMPFLEDRKKSYLFLGGIGAALIISVLLVIAGWVPVKMLPFDNKNEFQIMVDMPEGTSREETNRVARALGQYIITIPEVTHYQVYVGTASPMDFNGLVRHYYLRRGENAADLRINLADKRLRKRQSHEISLAIRPDIEKIGKTYNANLKIVELPPGPPVISTLTAEVYAPPSAPYPQHLAAAKTVRAAFAQTPNVVDIDDSIEDDQTKYKFTVDEAKAALVGISRQDIVKTVSLALGGQAVGTVHRPPERRPLEIRLQLPPERRQKLEDILSLSVKSRSGRVVPLGDLLRAEKTVEDKSIYHKELQRVVYVFGEMAGKSPVNAVFNLDSYFKKNPLPPGFKVVWKGEGEWNITVDVFRDMGLSYLVALVGIYILLVIQTQSFLMPLVIMVSIPLTMIGIMPGFLVLNLFFTGKVGPYHDYIFLTATAMIGMLALAGIVVRNSIILIDFIGLIKAREKGISLREAIVEAGATRLRPIVLTAAAAALGSWVIILDPIFSGLAWALIFGIMASTMFTLWVVPILYHLLYQKTLDKYNQIL